MDSKIKEIPIITENDGTVKAIKEEDKEYINQVNSVTKMIIEHIKPVADYLRENIFKEDKIMTQELSITDDKKVLALCDLSDSKNVVEIKTYDVLDENGQKIETVSKTEDELKALTGVVLGPDASGKITVNLDAESGDVRQFYLTVKAGMTVVVYDK